jgi:hypothetical protein
MTSAFISPVNWSSPQRPFNVVCARFGDIDGGVLSVPRSVLSVRVQCIIEAVLPLDQEQPRARAVRVKPGGMEGAAFAAGERGVLDGLSLWVEGIDFHHPAEAVGLVWVAGGVEALVLFMPAMKRGGIQRVKVCEGRATPLGCFVLMEVQTYAPSGACSFRGEVRRMA